MLKQHSFTNGYKYKTNDLYDKGMPTFFKLALPRSFLEGYADKGVSCNLVSDDATSRNKHRICHSRSNPASLDCSASTLSQAHFARDACVSSTASCCSTAKASRAFDMNQLNRNKQVTEPMKPLRNVKLPSSWFSKVR